MLSDVVKKEDPTSLKLASGRGAKRRKEKKSTASHYTQHHTNLSKRKALEETATFDTNMTRGNQKGGGGEQRKRGYPRRNLELPPETYQPVD
ncbi:hypothetical protein JR316_0009822 [Psilocybe cubensis]|uniref:Uncharacterized protein n=1 Tax=Psilocybe cubensis TaxID=181762 RepID=A0ACB8GQ48_PSICU|nr:hypothetical protein JR316_0009822 [Psilocybe cubensis]KAH9477600.1 hypothetical protein JR316_0009822 [Psilocybe cubensis]